MRRLSQSKGFSLIEMLVSLAVMLIVSGAAFYAMNFAQKQYGSQQLQADMHAGLRGAFEVMTQEIGQAGSLNLTPTTITPSAVTLGSSTAQTVGIGSAANVFVGEVLTVDAGSNQELVTVQGVSQSANQITGVFGKPHIVGAPVVALGSFPGGILNTSTATSLQLFGDLNADGTLVFVQYDCNTATNTLTRSSTVLASGVTAKNTPQILLSDLVANPGGTACFVPGAASTAAGFTNSFITNVTITLTVRTNRIDPTTGQYITMTKSLFNLAPRNIVAALNLAQSGNTGLLQPNPATTTSCCQVPYGLPLP